MNSLSLLNHQTKVRCNRQALNKAVWAAKQNLILCLLEVIAGFVSNKQVIVSDLMRAILAGLLTELIVKGQTQAVLSAKLFHNLNCLTVQLHITKSTWTGRLRYGPFLSRLFVEDNFITAKHSHLSQLVRGCLQTVAYLTKPGFALRPPASPVRAYYCVPHLG